MGRALSPSEEEIVKGSEEGQRNLKILEGLSRPSVLIEPVVNTSTLLELYSSRTGTPPSILREEINFKERIFDGVYSDVLRAEWKGQMVRLRA